MANPENDQPVNLELTPVKPNSYELADKSPKLNTFTADKLGGVNVDSFQVDSNRLRRTQLLNDWLEQLLIPVNPKSACIKFLSSFGVGLSLSYLAQSSIVGLLIVGFMLLPVWLLVKLTQGTHLHYFSAAYLLTGTAAFVLALVLAIL